MSFQALTAFGLALTGAATLVTASPKPLDLTTARETTSTRTFEVAMDGSSFSFQGGVTESGAPANGTPFVVSGYLYPEGTFNTYGELAGVTKDGSPEFPERVVGGWICRGWHIQDGDAVTGPVVATTQIIHFAEKGGQTVITEGIELADFGVPFERAITGGTGLLAGLDDSTTISHQTYVGNGTNASGGFNSTITFSGR